MGMNGLEWVFMGAYFNFHVTKISFHSDLKNALKHAGLTSCFPSIS